MALYHASLRVLSRAKGESAVAAAAYRAGSSLYDQRLGITHDYTRRKGVDSVAVLVPEVAPEWARDARALWNAVEAAEARVDARIARELIVGLPHELAPEPRLTLAHAIAQAVVDRYGMAVQVAVHAPDAHGDERNFHAHLLMTPRRMTASGLGSKVRILDEPKSGREEVRWIRERVADLTNAALVRAGVAERVDHRSLRAQAREAELQGDFERAASLTRRPQRHQGRAATAAARRGNAVDKVIGNARQRDDDAAALTRYLDRVRAEGRLMPASSDAPRSAWPVYARLKWKRRAPDLRVPFVGMQGMVGMPLPTTVGVTGGDAGSQVARDYLEGLRRSAQEGRRWLQAYMALSAQQQAVAAWLARTEERATLTALQRTVEAQREVHISRQRHRLEWKQWQQATEQRRQHQQAVDRVEAQAPKAWQLARQRRWQRERQAHWARLRHALAAEQTARGMSESATAQARSQTARLRDELRQFEAALQATLEGATEPSRRQPMPSIPSTAPAPARRRHPRELPR